MPPTSFCYVTNMFDNGRWIFFAVEFFSSSLQPAMAKSYSLRWRPFCATPLCRLPGEYGAILMVDTSCCTITVLPCGSYQFVFYIAAVILVGIFFKEIIRSSQFFFAIGASVKSSELILTRWSNLSPRFIFMHCATGQVRGWDTCYRRFQCFPSAATPYLHILSCWTGSLLSGHVYRRLCMNDFTNKPCRTMFSVKQFKKNHNSSFQASCNASLFFLMFPPRSHSSSMVLPAGTSVAACFRCAWHTKQLVYAYAMNWVYIRSTSLFRIKLYILPRHCILWLWSLHLFKCLLCSSNLSGYLSHSAVISNPSI